MDAIERLFKEICEKSHLYVSQYVIKNDTFLNLSDSVKEIVATACEATLTSYLLLQIIHKFQNTDFFKD